MRRLTGLLSSLLLLHLTLVGAALTCAKHGEHGRTDVSQSAASPHVHQHAATGPDESSYDDTSCQVPTLPACCQALASCGVSMAGDRSTESGDLSHLVASVQPGADDTPTSWTLEPDPPPPKA